LKINPTARIPTLHNEAHGEFESECPALVRDKPTIRDSDPTPAVDGIRPENQVRTGLTAGENEIRTVSPSPARCRDFGSLWVTARVTG
jgi:hypothetical protein